MLEVELSKKRRKGGGIEPYLTARIGSTSKFERIISAVVGYIPRIIGCDDIDRRYATIVCLVAVQFQMEVNRKAVKGILRPVGMRKERRCIEFDPLALMLDAALEGELDLVKSSAAKVSSAEY